MIKEACDKDGPCLRHNAGIGLRNRPCGRLDEKDIADMSRLAQEAGHPWLSGAVRALAEQLVDVMRELEEAS